MARPSRSPSKFSRTKGSSSMDYNQPTGGLPGDPYIGKNVAAGIQGSKVPPGAVEYPQRETVNVIMAAGITPSNGNLAQLWQASMGGAFTFADTGTANAFACALPAGLTFPSGSLKAGTR